MSNNKFWNIFAFLSASLFFGLLFNVLLIKDEKCLERLVIPTLSKSTDFRLTRGKNDDIVATGKLGAFYDCIIESMANERLSHKQGIRADFIRLWVSEDHYFRIRASRGKGYDFNIHRVDNNMETIEMSNSNQIRCSFSLLEKDKK